MSSLFNFQGVNWWVLLGGMGMNFIITMVYALLGAYLGSNEATADTYAQIGPPVMVLAIFLSCILAGFIAGKLADAVLEGKQGEQIEDEAAPAVEAAAE